MTRNDRKSLNIRSKNVKLNVSQDNSDHLHLDTHKRCNYYTNLYDFILEFKSVWEYKNQPREIVIFAYIKLSKVINFIAHLVASNHAIIKAAHQVRNALQ